MGKFVMVSYFLSNKPNHIMLQCRDTPEADIVGCNLYQRYIEKNRQTVGANGINSIEDPRPCIFNDEIMAAINELKPQCVEEVISILVCTGVYQHGVSPEPGSEEESKNYRGHRDFPKAKDLYKPHVMAHNVGDAIDYILNTEQKRANSHEAGILGLANETPTVPAQMDPCPEFAYL